MPGDDGPDRPQGLPPITYTRCPKCQSIGPPAWEVRPPAATGDLMPVTICCAFCGTVHEIHSPAELHTELDAVMRHATCGAVVAYPSVAQIVRCSTRGPGVTRDTGCQELIPAPLHRQP